MKKSLLALAVLGAFAGAASAQSSVTLYGKVDLGVAKATGSADKQIRDGSGSRVGIRGVEDLGGGMKALFGFEHRFNPDTGKDATNDSSNGTAPGNASNTFWNGYSTVGLGGAFGTVNLGRQYTAAFSLVTNTIDPFGGDTVGGLRGESLTKAVGRVRTQNSLRYDGTFGGLKFAADVAEQESAEQRPYSVAAQYAAGPVLAVISYDNPGDKDDHMLSVGGAFTFGPAKVALGVGYGKDASANKVKQGIIGLTFNVGPSGRLLAGYAQQKVASNDPTKKGSVGYRHDLSKRTQLYTDISRVSNSITKTERNAYDFGVLHTF